MECASPIVDTEDCSRCGFDSPGQPAMRQLYLPRLVVRVAALMRNKRPGAIELPVRLNRHTSLRSDAAIPCGRPDTEVVFWCTFLPHDQRALQAIPSALPSIMGPPDPRPVVMTRELWAIPLRLILQRWSKSMACKKACYDGQR
jgi:hypothetical protein